MSSWAARLRGEGNNSNSSNNNTPTNNNNSSAAPPKAAVAKIEVRENELKDLSAAANRLWDLDSNRLTPGKDYKISLQGYTKGYKTEDMARDPLFTWVDPQALNKPTFKTFTALLDNYVRETGTTETVTKEEVRENWAFLDAISSTGPIRYLHQWLLRRGLTKAHSEQDFKGELKKIWFDLYTREARNDSSGFEHVFVGEVKQGKVTGCHNWLQIYNEEKKGALDYKGWIKPRSRNATKPTADFQLLTIQFSWEDEMKSVSSSFIGVSPEFEIALYTMCFLNGQEDTHIEVDDYSLTIKCYKFKGKLGTSFPIADE